MAREIGNRWLGDAQINGKRRRLVFSTKQEAESFERDPYKHLHIAKVSNTIGELFPIWTREVYGKTRNEKNAFRIADELVKRLGQDLPVSGVDRKAIKALVLTLRKEGNKDSTINTKMSILSRLLRYAVDEEALDVVPAIPFYNNPQGRIRSLTKAEEETLFSYLTPEHRHFANFLLYTGCRVGEALSLKKEDIDGDTVTFWRTKTDRPRSVPLAQKAKDALSASTSSQPFAHIVYSTFTKDWQRAKLKAGLSHDPQVVPHVLRHTCATRLGKAKMDPLRMKEWLGHSTLQMTSRYTHLDVSDLRAGVAALDCQ